MKRWFRITALGVMGLILLGGVILQLSVLRFKGTQSELAIGRPLAGRLPVRLATGGVHDEPIAATEEMRKAVGELLNFNDGIYRIYQLPGVRISVYAAWWESGRMSPRLVATHTPDVCWPANGWQRDRPAETGLEPLRTMLSADDFARGECRVFQLQGKREYVVFWHKVGGEMLSYATGEAPPWWAWLDEMRRGGLNLRQEQLFVRVSSDQPLQEVWLRPELEPLRNALLQLGLRGIK